VPDITFAPAILKEALIWASAAALIVIIRRGECLTMRSIGLGTARWWVSILWGFVIAVVSAAVVGGLAYLTGYGHGPGSVAFEKLPLWLITLIVFRAGVRIILSRLRDRTAADDRAWAILVRRDSAGNFLAWPLVRRRSKYSYRACGRYNLDGILSMAS
jgi:hypothetical protein